MKKLLVKILKTILPSLLEMLLPAIMELLEKEIGNLLKKILNQMSSDNKRSMDNYKAELKKEFIQNIINEDIKISTEQAKPYKDEQQEKK